MFRRLNQLRRVLQEQEQIMKLNKNIILLGLTSFFTDVSSEMIYPLIQAFVSMMLATKAALLGPVLGMIEGIAESTASLLKVFVGYYSDKIQQRKNLTIAGYALSAGAKILLFLASLGWYVVMFSRWLDRIGKGIRTAPRDALIAESTPKEIQGKAYGFHRAMDFAGAFLGVLICYLVSLHFLDPVTQNFKDLHAFYVLFIISVIPAIIGMFFLFFVQEQKMMQTERKLKPRPNLDIRKYDQNLQWFFLAQFMFTLGNSSNQFLLLRSQNLGHALSTVILMYMVFNLSSTLLSTFFGSLSDKIGRRTILMIGYAIYAVVYMSFGFITEQNKGLLWLFWIIYGIYYAMTEGVEKAFVSDLASAESKATALGFSHTIVGVTLLPASIIAGFLFSLTASAPFIFGGVMSGLAIVVMACCVREKPVI
jgi:MFS family permease